LATILDAADGLAYAIGCGIGTAPRTETGVLALGLSRDDEASCVERVHRFFKAENPLFA